MNWKDVWDGSGRSLEDRLKGFSSSFVIDFTRNGVRGQLENRNLQPLQLIDTNLFEGLLPLERGGTNADLSGTGPGVLFQATSGATVTVGDLPFSFLDFTTAGSADNELLIYNTAGGGTAAFGAVDLTSPNWRTGVLPASAGGTGVNNSTRTLTITSNGGTLLFSAASKTLTIPDSGTAALLGLAQTFSAVNTFSVETRLRGIDFGLSPASDFVIRHGTAATGTLMRMSPNGNGLVNSASFQVFNTDWTASQTNFELFTFGWNNDTVVFISQRGGTGVLRDMQFANANGNFTLRATGGYLDISQYIQLTEISAPAAGAANTGRLFLRDNGAGKTQLCVIFNTGAIQVIATQP
jgi:hypothetical protein